MQIIIKPTPCACGDLLPLAPDTAGLGAQHHCIHGLHQQSFLTVGTRLIEDDRELFQVVGQTWLGCDSSPGGCYPILKASVNVEDSHQLVLNATKSGYAIAVITLSDKGSQGVRKDTSGPLVMKMAARAVPMCHSAGFIIPDDKERLRALLCSLALEQGYDLIITTGGTGLGPRDITPQVVEKLLDLSLPGFTQAMLSESIRRTPNAIISRAAAGVVDKCLIVTLPGSEKAARENMEAISPALGHALAKLHGDTTDCGDSHA